MLRHVHLEDGFEVEFPLLLFGVVSYDTIFADKAAQGRLDDLHITEKESRSGQPKRGKADAESFMHKNTQVDNLNS
ncbi:MAG: hypothetical protein F7B06_06955 [Opitutae bacterium]|nr:hypothetical protein [Opitutae bacterium]